MGGSSGLLETERAGLRGRGLDTKPLAKHVREQAVKAGHPSLSRTAKATVQRILAEQPLHPEKGKYCLERCDPDFEANMREILAGVSRGLATQVKARSETRRREGTLLWSRRQLRRS